jgi:hypothetical protein
MATAAVGLERGVSGAAFIALGGAGQIALGLANLLEGPTPKLGGVLRQISFVILCLSLIGLLVSYIMLR